jgi:hypothetical protein
MTDKKKIKTIVLVLISFIFLFMFYNTFFKSKKNASRPAPKKQTLQPAAILPGKVPAIQAKKITIPVSEPNPAGGTGVSIQGVSIQAFKPFIPDIFEPFIPDKSSSQSDTKKLEPGLADSLKRLVTTKILPVLSEQEKNSISQGLDFKGSILSSNNAVAIINDEFIHVGDNVNGYKVASISEQQVAIDTGRGTIILEIMTHE